MHASQEAESRSSQWAVQKITPWPDNLCCAAAFSACPADHRMICLPAWFLQAEACQQAWLKRLVNLALHARPAGSLLPAAAG